MSVNELVLVQGMSDTKETLAEWNRRPWPVFRTWLFWSVVTAVGLLCAVYVVAKLSRQGLHTSYVRSKRATSILKTSSGFSEAPQNRQ